LDEQLLVLLLYGETVLLHLHLVLRLLIDLHLLLIFWSPCCCCSIWSAMRRC
jgi:hypothetical protein